MTTKTNTTRASPGGKTRRGPAVGTTTILPDIPKLALLSAPQRRCRRSFLPVLLAMTSLLAGATSGLSSTAPVISGPLRVRAPFTGAVRQRTPTTAFVVSPSPSARCISRSGVTQRRPSSRSSGGLVVGIARSVLPGEAALPVGRGATKTRRSVRGPSSLLASTGDTENEPEPEPSNSDDGAGSKSMRGGIIGGSSSPPRDTVFDLRTTLTLISAQALLIVCAAVLATFFGTPNLGLGSNFLLDKNSIVAGTVFTVPLFGLAFGLDAVEDKFPPLKDVTRATQRSVLGLLGERRRPLLATVTAIALGLVAGLGEEMLFRGVLQTELCTRFLLTPAASIALTSLAFGALHAVTPLYAILASLASAFFGVLLVRSDGNLAVPIVCHGLYDVGALLWAHYVVTGMTEMERREVMDWTP